MSAFTHHAFPDDVIALAVRWYVRYRLSYADVVEWFAERGQDSTFQGTQAPIPRNRRCGWLSQQAGIRVKGAQRSDWGPANGGRAIGMAHP